MIELQNLSNNALLSLQSELTARVSALNRDIINHEFKKDSYLKRKASQERRLNSLLAELQAAEDALQNLINNGADAVLIQEYQNDRDLIAARKLIVEIGLQQNNEVNQVLLAKEAEWYQQQMNSYQQFSGEIETLLTP